MNAPSPLPGTPDDVEARSARGGSAAPAASQAGGSGAGARWRLAFLASLAAICGATAFVGVVPTAVFGHDTFFLLDNGWRLWWGQRPHVDFFSATGPVTYLVTWLGFLLSDASPNGIGYGNAIAGLVIGMWAWRLSRGRLVAGLRELYAVTLTLLTVAPYAIGMGPWLSSHAMVYNRYGYALTGLVVLECLQPVVRAEAGAGEFLGGLSTGAAIALALFTKVSYFGICLPIVGASLWFHGLSRRRLWGLALGFAAFAGVFLVYLRFDLPRMVQDLRIAADGRRKMLEIFWVEMALKAYGAVPALLTLLALFLYGSAPRRDADAEAEHRRFIFWGLLLYAVDGLLLFGNMQWRSMPVLAIFGILAADRATVQVRQAGSNATRAERQRYIFLLLLCGMLSLPQFLTDLAGLGYGVLQKALPSVERSRVRFSVARLGPMILYDGPFAKRANGGVYTSRINEGIGLLEANCGPEDRVLNLDMVDPFPYALGWKPARGGMAAAAHNNLFTDQMRPTDDEYFGNATVVMVPKVAALDDVFHKGLYRIYCPGLMQRYRLAIESESWRLYKLK